MELSRKLYRAGFGLVAAVSVGAIAYAGLRVSQAATFAIAKEAESGIVTTATTPVEPGASGGSAVKFDQAGGGSTGCQPLAKTDGGTWQCSFSDEFNDTTLASTWSPIPYSLGQACLVTDPAHLKETGGSLQVIATNTNTSGCAWTGGGMESLGKFSQHYGRFEIRAKIPAANSSWPAFWLLPDDNSYDGEIDIFEMLGGDNENVGGSLLPGNQHLSFTLHTPAGGPGPTTRCTIKPDDSSDYHTYTFEWTASGMKLLVDGIQCLNFTGYSDAGTSPPAFPATYNKAYHILVNLAVAPDGWGLPAPSPTPMTMYVDYVRVWK